MAENVLYYGDNLDILRRYVKPGAALLWGLSDAELAENQRSPKESTE